VALDVRVAVSGELFDGGVQRVHRLTSNDKIKGAIRWSARLSLHHDNPIHHRKH
jgi:hypothetical protein